MSLRIVSAAVLLMAAHAQDAPVEDVAPEEVGRDIFQGWCSTAQNCFVGNFPADAGSDIQCNSGSCVCSGSYEDPGIALGADFTGWACVPQNAGFTEFDMIYAIVWNSQTIDCENRPVAFDAAIVEAAVAFFELTNLEFTPVLCGSIHMTIKGRTRLAGKRGFSEMLANDNNNPFGAPVVTGQKVILAPTCTAVSPVATTVLINGLCQPLSCITGFTLVTSGSITAPSQCVVTPPVGVVATAVPQPDGTGVVIVNRSSGDDLSYGAIFGIAFGSAALIAIVVGVVALVLNKKAPEEEPIQLNEEEQVQQNENNGPDKEDPLV